MKIDVFASGSSGNCYRLIDGETAVLIECGIGAARILRHINYRLGDIAGVLVSHEHGDHAKAMCELARLGADIYASRGTFEAVGAAGHRCRVIRAGQRFTVGSFEVYPFDTEHDAAEPLGFVLTSRVTRERVLFFTDTYYVRYVFPRVDIIMGECNYSLKTLREDLPKSRRDRLFESHMSLENLLALLENYPDVKRIYLLHLSDDNSDAEMFRREVARKTGAEVLIHNS